VEYNVPVELVDNCLQRGGGGAGGGGLEQKKGLVRTCKGRGASGGARAVIQGGTLGGRPEVEEHVQRR